MALNYDSPLIDNTTGSPTLDSLKSGSDKINGALTEIKEEVNDLGSASLVDTGTAAGDVPLNSSLVPKSGGTFTGDIAAPKITASTGILFGTDTAAANTLDDYEEGTFSVTTSALTNMSDVSFSGAVYTKIGDLVNIQCYGTFTVTNGPSVKTNMAFSLPFSSVDLSISGGGGRVRSPSNGSINPGMQDPNSGSGTTLGLEFNSLQSGSHLFSFAAQYKAG